MHISEIKLQFGNKTPYIPLYFTAFRIKNAQLPPIFFFDSNSPSLDLFYPHSHKPRKNTSLLVGTVLTSKGIDLGYKSRFKLL